MTIKADYDRMLWLAKEGLPLKRIKRRLTLMPEGTNEEIELFDESRPGLIGVPREWAYARELDLKLRDMTLNRPRVWPQFKGSWREGQEASVKSLLSHFRMGCYGGLLEAKCGSGKTVMGTAVAAQMNTPTLVVVPKTDLAQQWKDTAQDFFGASVGNVCQDEWDYKGHHMVTASAQTLWARRESIPVGFWETFGMLIYDECHRFPCKTFSIALSSPCARYRLGVSATFRRKDGMDEVWTHHIGPVVHTTKVKSLPAEYVQIPWQTHLRDSQFKLHGGGINHSKWVTTISEDAAYTHWLVSQILTSASAGRHTLVCSHRTDQLATIRRMLETQGFTDVGYYAGKVEGRTIKAAELEESKSKKIVLATFNKMAEGTDIPSLDTLFLATPAGDIEQVVGRIQRKDSGKKNLLIIDPVWNTRYMKALGNKRLRFYNSQNFKDQANG